MPQPGDVISNPGMGARIVFEETPANNDGRLLRFRYFLGPHRTVAPAHVHPRQVERFEVVAGTLHGKVGGRELTAGPGHHHTNEPGTPHTWWNAGGEEAELLVEFRPGMRTDELFDRIFALSRAGKANRQGIPSPLQLAVLLDAYPDEFYPAALPLPVTRALVRIAAPVARLLGYRPAA